MLNKRDEEVIQEVLTKIDNSYIKDENIFFYLFKKF